MNNLYHPLGIIRETPLWGIIVLIVSIVFFQADFGTIFHLAQSPGNPACAFMILSIPLYPFFVILHILLVKITKLNNLTAAEHLAVILIHDIGTPFRSIWSLLQFLTKKMDFKGRTSFQTFIFAEQSISEWIWTFCIIVFATHTFLSFG